MKKTRNAELREAVEVIMERIMEDEMKAMHIECIENIKEECKNLGSLWQRWEIANSYINARCSRLV